MIIGIDIGGANTKIASSDGTFVESHYLPLWTGSNLNSLLKDLKRRVSPIAVGVVMTGELSDCFKSKEEGISYIFETVKDTFPGAKFLNTDGSFEDDIKENPLSFSAANWIASSNFVGRQEKNALFVDIGSTTTDVIPIINGRPVAKNTDFERLKNSELIYNGVLRTNVAALLSEVRFKDSASCRTSSELFAITADAYMVLGDISSDCYSCEPPDWYAYEEAEGKDRNSAMNRLARVVCCDLLELGEENVKMITMQVKEEQIKVLTSAIEAIRNRSGLKRMVACGLGEFLAKEAASRLDMECLSISEKYGRDISVTFPAYAVAGLLEEE
ncbi:MAG: hydantoinase/oxoprolinase family protein [Halobacteriota archaeon]|nr:hydantoinase/oxoprolinase family protein [Halobacteriota archaeon]